MNLPTHEKVVGMRVDATTFDQVIDDVLRWSTNSESRYVCVANVHMAMEAHDDRSFRSLVDAADIVTPDGMPLVWMLRKLGRKDQPRVNGPELMLRLSKACAEQNVPIGLIGGKPDVLEDLAKNLNSQFPELKIVYKFSPPFRTLTTEEEAEIARQVQDSGAKVLFVGLGCPKQERWMASQRGKVPAVMLGVGAAFDIHAGRTREAPRLWQKCGMEWFYRLLTEPKRLWKRYFKHNPRFMAMAIWQLLFKRRTERS